VKGIILPKSQKVADIDLVTNLLSKYEKSSNISPLQVIALIETAEGVLNARFIADHPRVVRMILGEIDLRADLSLPQGSNDETIQFARNQILYASAAARIDRPVASVSTNFKDLDRYRTSTHEYANWGYFGRTCIHPDQVPVVNEVFSPSKEEQEWARDVLDRLEKATGGSTIDSRGEMIDEAVAKSARRILGRSTFMAK
jgi:citrate lyase subunit beta/citryl-CoA lyase